jgi:hypothetical protein
MSQVRVACEPYWLPQRDSHIARIIDRTRKPLLARTSSTFEEKISLAGIFQAVPSSPSSIHTPEKAV